MKTWRLFAMVAVVVVLGSYIVCYERHQPTKQERQEQAEKIFPELKQDNIVAVAIRNESGELRLERQDEQWRLSEPIDVAADATAVGGLLTALLGLKAERRLAAGEVDPAVHGLAEPKMAVALTTGDGDTVRIEVGNKAALGSNRAISIGDGSIILCAGWFTSDLDRDLEGWRSRDVIDILESDLAAIELATAGDRLHLVRRQQQWLMVEPLADLADREHVRNLISNLNALEVKSFLDSTVVDVTELGLDPPRAHVTIVPATGGDPTVLELGTTREQDGSTQVACRRNGSELLWVTDRAEASLGLAPVRWRSSVLYPFDSWDVQGVRITIDGTTAELSRTSGIWSFTDSSEANSSEANSSEANSGEANSGNVLDRLAALSRLTATDFDLVDTGRPEAGTVELRLTPGTIDGDEAEQTVTYTFWHALETGGQAMVRVSERATLMAVESTALDEILGDLAQLRPTPDGNEQQPAPAPDLPAR